MHPMAHWEPDMIEFTQPRLIIRSRQHQSELEQKVRALMREAEKQKKLITHLEVQATQAAVAMNAPFKLSDILKSLGTA